MTMYRGKTPRPDEMESEGLDRTELESIKRVSRLEDMQR